MTAIKLRRQNNGDKGTGHWFLQRLSALLLVPLSLWLVTTFVMAYRGSYAGAQAWVSAPFNSTLLILTLAILLLHAHLGLQVVIDDYLSGYQRKLLVRISGFVSFVGCGITVVSVLKVYLGD